MKITKDFPGGNIIVKAVDGNTVYLEDELRDTDGFWFYWAFRCEGKKGETVHFVFDMEGHELLGYYGPAISRDFENWEWLGTTTDRNRFSFTFPADEAVYFAHHMLYRPERFFAFAKEKGLSLQTLCQSEHGNAVPFFTFGNGSRPVILTARHHACESTGNYVLEGVLDALLQCELPDLKVFCVPFVDYDGVLCGDQGKNRIPHDHNRDYIEQPIYPAVQKIMDYVKENGVFLAFDFHSPWHLGGRNDAVFVVRGKMKNPADQDRFCVILQTATQSPEALRYTPDDDIYPDVDWNQSSNPSFPNFMRKSGAQLSFTLETTFFGRSDNVFSQEKAIETGRCFAKSLLEYLAE